MFGLGLSVSFTVFKKLTREEDFLWRNFYAYSRKTQGSNEIRSSLAQPSWVQTRFSDVNAEFFSRADAIAIPDPLGVKNPQQLQSGEVQVFQSVFLLETKKKKRIGKKILYIHGRTDAHTQQ